MEKGGLGKDNLWVLGDFVLSADEKPSIQARRRKHRSLSPAPTRPDRIEHEYERKP